jgi:hypothetical protein
LPSPIRSLLLARATRALISATVILAACSGGGHDTPTAPVLVLTTLSVTVAPASIQVGQAATATASGLDQNGAAISTGTVAWSSSATGIATVNSSGVVAGAGAGQTQIVASAGGKQGQATITVTAVPVTASVSVSLSAASVGVGQTVTATATVFDQFGALLPGRPVTWSTSSNAIATVNSAGVVTGVTAGQVQVIATVDGKPGQVTLTVTAVQQAQCSGTNAVQLALGEVRNLTSDQVASLCLTSGASASEYVLIPFSNSNVAASQTTIQITGTNTSAILAPPLAALAAIGTGLARLGSTTARGMGLGVPQTPLPDVSMEMAFRERERREIDPLRAAAIASGATAGRVAPSVPSHLTNIPATPAVGSIVQLNANLTGGACDAKQLRGAKVITVLPHTILVIDTLAPAGGYTNAELIAFATSFDTLGYGLDTLNFGLPSDIDLNGRVLIFFTPGVNQIPGPPGGFIGGLFYGRDLITATGPNGCAGSNEGEMFYMPIPDPNQTINGNYKDKTALSNVVLATLVHEFQHLINAGRRQFVNHAPTSEEIWLNEGLSHVAEELLYYRVSGNSPRANLSLTLLRSSQAQVDAFNIYELQNFGRLLSYLTAPTANSPFSQVDGLAMRGAIWGLLRYSADRKGGPERNTWQALVNTTASGQANFNTVFGDLISMTRDWTVAQFLDDSGLLEPDKYTNPSWNFRSIYPALTTPSRFPIATVALGNAAPVTLTLNGGSPAYMRFRIAASVFATVASTAFGQPVGPGVDFILVRTQ